MSHAARKRRQRRARGGAARVLLIVIATFVVGMAVAGAGAVAYVASVANGVDLDELRPKNPGATSVVYAADGQRLGFISGPTLRTPVRQRDIADNVREATVAVEDRRFFEHGGVDVEGVFRAALRNFAERETKEGASTLEMQLIRNLYTGDRDDSYKRKIREAKLADQLEKRHPGRSGKEWVLTTYLNTAPYGNAPNGQNINGVQAAARVYFNTTAKRLTLAQAAMIAGLPQAPSAYNPYRAPQAALDRRNDVLRRMADQGYITDAEAAEAQGEDLGITKGGYYAKRREQFFLNYVRAKLIKFYGEKTVAEGGLKVYTTIDLKKQALARKAIAAHLNPAAGDPSSAVVTIDPRTGDIQAAASSAVFGQNQYDLATQGRRQPGSTFKTIVLAEALNQGFSPSTTYSAPATFPIPPQWGTGVVRNFAGESGGGNMDLVTATLKSVNTVFFQLDLDVGPKNVTKMARKVGITSKLISVPSEALGAASVSPLEMARAYATFANGGRRVNPRAITKVVRPGGKVDHPQPVKLVRTVSKPVASEVTRILQKDIQSGTASSANFGCPAAAKTGTTDGPSDVWLVGYTPRMSTAVWVGYPASRKTIYSTSSAGGNIQGATVPGPIWHDYMAAAHGKFCGEFQGLVPFSGVRTSSGSPAGTDPYGDGSGSGDGQTYPDGYGYDYGEGNRADPGSGASGDNGTGDGTSTTPRGGDRGGGGGGRDGRRYPRELYESPPQAPPR
ncbi:transglycosylase domain-containing protein [Patulibacter defluvii]|uniref:transglycosylase domain-containing protein n=1 Tax=Patulibacter defluvii TaxID=3095358 RepID=UPI002A752764|nr:transglycosylase domain-containing protein [Patulibacter sp. DM4]